jgi:hypothetical protein
VATYWRGFADGITDWTEVALTSGHTDPAWSVVSTDQLQATSASSHNEALVWNDIDADGDRDDFEILCQVYVDSNATTHQWLVGRVPTSGTRTGYSCRVRTSSIDVYRFTGSTFTSIAGTTKTTSSGTWCWVRFRVNAGTMKARLWADGDGEPGTWDVDTTDSNYTTAGHVGCKKATNTTTQKWRYFGVGTNGDTAPSSGFAAVSFSGTVPTINGTRKTSQPAQSPTIASYFTGTETPFSYAVQSGTLPAGLSINSSTGVISGTPTVTGTQTGIVIRATDQDSATADTNSFSIAIAAAAVPDLSDVAMTSITGTTAVVNVDVYF